MDLYDVEYVHDTLVLLLKIKAFFFSLLLNTKNIFDYFNVQVLGKTSKKVIE